MNGEQLVKSNELVNKDFNIDRDGASIKEHLMNFRIEKIELILIIWYIHTKPKEEVQKILVITKIWQICL